MNNQLTRKGLQEQARQLYKIPEDKLSAVPSVFTKEQQQLLHTSTPEKHIHYFPANAGKMAGLAFVTGGYMKHMLDRLTGGLWSFEVKEKGNTAGQIWVLGRLTLYKQDGSPLIFKEQFGRAQIKYLKDRSGQPTDKPVDIGNDMKAASTDALKKCASELGIARDIYAANEFIEAEIIDRQDVTDIEPSIDDKAPITRPVVDEKYKQYVTKLLMELYPKTFDRMQFIKVTTAKLSLDKFTEFDWTFLCGELEAQKLAAIEADKEE